MDEHQFCKEISIEVVEKMQDTLGLDMSAADKDNLVKEVSVTMHSKITTLLEQDEEIDNGTTGKV